MQVASQGGHGPGQMMMEQQKQLFRYGEQCLWSSQLLTTAQALANQSFRLFTTPQGQVGQGYTLPLSRSETNLNVGGQLPQAQAFDVFGVALQILGSTATVDGASFNQPAVTAAAISDVLTVLNNCILQWAFTQSFVDIAPAMLVGQGGGVYGAISTTQNASDRGHMQNGNGACWLYRQYPVALPALVVFGIQLIFGSRSPALGTNIVSLRGVLLGYYRNLIEVGN